MSDFVERRIQQAKRAGVFDELEFKGRPIPDLDTERPEGWWAASFIARDRSIRALREHADALARRRAAALSEPDYNTVLTTLLELRSEMAEANAEVDEIEQVAWFDVDADLAAWRRRNRIRRWGSRFPSD